jgi:CHAT domain-containing protein
LTALEVSELDLQETELVVLSACQTGRGLEAGGEGLLGLQRAFQVAGARSVVASLWYVDDDITRKLMTAFYKNFWQKGQPTLQALREAQLEILNGTDVLELEPGQSETGTPLRAGRRPPWLWAAWVFSGDPGVRPPAPEPVRSWWIPLLALGTTVAVGGGLWYRRRRR